MLFYCMIFVRLSERTFFMFLWMVFRVKMKMIDWLIDWLILYVPPQRVWFLGLFGLKTGIEFAHFGLESAMVFEGTTGAYERIYRFMRSIPNE